MSDSCADSALHGLGVLVTRPAHQAMPLCRLIEAHGGIAICWPTLCIVAPADVASATDRLRHLADYHLVIFASVNAVEHSWPTIQQSGLPKQVQIAAIGAATAAALAAHGMHHCLRPAHGFTSETLLALPRFQNLHRQRILIVRGSGGRTLLRDTLMQRGAQVDCAEVYRRAMPEVDAALRQALLDNWEQRIGAVLITSGESLQNLFAMLGTAGQPYIRSTPLVVVSARIQYAAAQQGCRHIRLAREASDDALLAALLDLMRTSPPESSGN